VEGKKMEARSILTRFFTAAASVLMLAAVSGGNAYAEFVPGFELPGIVPASYPNFENSVKLKVKKSRSGFKVKVNRKGKGNYFNLSSTESLDIKGARYKLIANFDFDGNFLDGTLKIKGKVDTEFGKAKGTLMTATLGKFAYSGSLLGFNTHDIVCNSIINELIGGSGCTSNESVYIDLEKSGFDPTLKGFKSKGLSVASVPVPAAVWLFGSGLIALVGVTRRRKH
jgi:hypothetical protein